MRTSRLHLAIQTWMSEEELLAVPGLQAVVIETPNSDLAPTAMRCLNRGLAMHMDKPGGEDMELFGKLLQGCREKKLPFQMGYMFRHRIRGMAMKAPSYKKTAPLYMARRWPAGRIFGTIISSENSMPVRRSR